MSSPTGHRPGGLTALAVLNFVFGGLGAIGLLLLWGLVSAANSASGGAVHAALAEAAPVMALVYVSLLLSVIGVVLLIASGVGYLGQKAFLGKTMGSVYGLVAIVNTGVGYAGTHQFGVMTIVGLVYPILTLVLLNTVFKD